MMHTTNTVLGGTMRTRTTAAAALILAAALAGCSSSDGDNKAADSPSTSPEPAAETSEPTTEPTPTRQPVLKMGTEWQFEGSDGIQGAVTVIDYKQGFKSVGDAAEEGAAGYEWAYLELKTCSTVGTFPATTTPWTLAYEDGSRVEPSSTTYGDFPKPEFPFETTLTGGKCVRGKLAFSVPGDSWPLNVVYAPIGLDVPQEWAIPATG